MAETPQVETPQPLPRHAGFRLVIIMIVLAALLGAYFWRTKDRAEAPANSASQLPFGSEQQAYAPYVRIGNLSISRSENFLHQEVTTLAGELTNTGARPVKDIQITAEFFDDLHQVVLRDAQNVFKGSLQPLNPGERRSFEISFEHVPTSWNMRQPQIHISGLLFALLK